MVMVDISIVVPVYNAERYLHKCINSILCQTKKEFELIMINDGSIDKSLSILQYYERRDDRIKIYNQDNMGVSTARNLGISVANGKYISFLDADDFVDQEMIKELFDSAEHNQADCVMCDFYHESHANYKVEIIHSNLPKSILFKNDILEIILPRLIGIEPKRNIYKINLWGSIWNYLFKTEIIKVNNIQFNTNLTIAEDLLFKIEYLFLCELLFSLNKPFYHYVRHDTSVTLKYNPKIIEIYEMYISQLMSIIDKKNLNSEFAKNIQYKSFLYIGIIIHYICTVSHNLSFTSKRKLILELYKSQYISMQTNDICTNYFSIKDKIRYFLYKLNIATIFIVVYNIRKRKLR
jgi:glycosyltransferase involved in cell wall biosynthesis